MRPLYKRLATAELRLEPSGHTGLWYDKFCDAWSAEWTLTGAGAKSPKQAWIESVANGRGVGEAHLLAESTTRVRRLVEARGGLSACFVTESRFVTGLGRSHPVENGFVWHATLGVPCLPGSSVKGLVRAWASREAAPRPTAAQLDRLLGKSDTPHQAGQVVFLDAVPIAPVVLEVDVMTPHYTGWTPDHPPGDWRDPVPVPFLTVAQHAVFLFAIVPRGIEAQDLELVFGWLRDALENLGAGAKTAVGYGRFALDEARTQALANEQATARAKIQSVARRAALEQTAEGRWRLALDGKRESDVLELVRLHLEKQPMSDRDERRAFARAVAATSYPILWRSGKKHDAQTQTGTDKLKARARLVDAAVAETDPRQSD